MVSGYKEEVGQVRCGWVAQRSVFLSDAGRPIRSNKETLDPAIVLPKVEFVSPQERLAVGDRKGRREHVMTAVEGNT
jgi:hypothetical protein